jgi:hypothetical protein
LSVSWSFSGRGGLWLTGGIIIFFSMGYQRGRGK